MSKHYCHPIDYKCYSTGYMLDFPRSVATGHEEEAVRGWEDQNMITLSCQWTKLWYEGENGGLGGRGEEEKKDKKWETYDKQRLTQRETGARKMWPVKKTKHKWSLKHLRKTLYKEGHKARKKK